MSQYIQLGLPVLPNGKVNLETALNWVEGRFGNSSPRLNGSRAPTQGLSGLRPTRYDANDPGVKARRAMGLMALDELNIEREFDRGAIAMAILLVYRAEAIAALAAADAGAPVRVAYAIGPIVVLALMEEIANICTSAGIAPYSGMDDPPIYYPEFFWRVNWVALAARLGEPVNYDAWKAWKCEVYARADAEDRALAEAEAREQAGIIG